MDRLAAVAFHTWLGTWMPASLVAAAAACILEDKLVVGAVRTVMGMVAVGLVASGLGHLVVGTLMGRRTVLAVHIGLGSWLVEQLMGNQLGSCLMGMALGT